MILSTDAAKIASGVSFFSNSTRYHSILSLVVRQQGEYLFCCLIFPVEFIFVGLHIEIKVRPLQFPPDRDGIILTICSRLSSCLFSAYSNNNRAVRMVCHVCSPCSPAVNHRQVVAADHIFQFVRLQNKIDLVSVLCQN